VQYLDFACEILGAKMTDNDKVTLMNHYQALEAFPDSQKSAQERVGCEFHSFPTPQSPPKQHQ